jgi:flagellar biosynthesis protein FlhF
MRIERFVAPTISEAIAQVRRALGPDAILLRTETVRRGGLFGLFGRRLFEVVATRDLQALDRGRRATRPAGRPRAVLPAAAASSPAEAAEGSGDKVSTPLEVRLARVQQSLDSLLQRPAMIDGEANNGFAPALSALHQALVSSDVPPDLARSLVQRLQQTTSGELLDDTDALRARLRETIARLLGSGTPIALHPGQSTRIAVVGPTGAGKTTTVAKLAAQFRLRESRRVALMTCDTYRIAAVEQLQRYAKLLGVPCRVVHTPADVKRAVEEFRDFDLVLMDTMGRSHRHERHLAELREFVAALDPHETHLLVSMTSGARTLEAMVRSFDRLGVSRLIFSKADESQTFGLVLAVVAGLGKPLSYITTGQEVPDDIEVGRPSRVARLILGEEAA